jgi:nucleoid-associated protein YgaU
MTVAPEFAPLVSVPERARPFVPEAPARLASVTVLHPPRTVAATPPLRLTRRGVLAIAAAVATLGGLLVWLAALSAPERGAAPAAPQAVTVRVGDTLWSIATRVAPDRDPVAEVAALQRRNHLVGADLAPGQVLRIP